jgi:hypothetical protein
VFSDPDGVRIGTSQQLAEITLTPAVKLSRHVIVRGDFRLDRSTWASFETASGFATRQSTAAFNAVLVF